MPNQIFVCFFCCWEFLFSFTILTPGGNVQVVQDIKLCEVTNK